MLNQKTKTIDGCDYKVRQLPATKGRAVMLKMMRVFSTLFDGSAKTEDEQNVRLLESLGAASEEDFSYLCNIFAESTDVVVNDEKGKREPKLSNIFDLHFAGRYESMLKWLFFCIEVNFSGFFGKKAKPQSSGSAAPETESSSD